ncbi:hypothetical protein IMW82_02835 [Rhodanobacter sp. B2A1Ga4]|uniref:hypothetical protein n=1 Tax=Rhodanobacter sp. B2A1Ga4 TaxID=2778647 RepID=UPI001B362368|nr:hypothetical protein [Rhodanobacter sp. B2A1Ga4]MBQ4853613.1 hypothetical protein [Rhodanobacter sp. B2A1Ga4]
MTSPALHPYTARELSYREVRDEDVYTFHSPKHAMRRVRVAYIATYMLALVLEFDPNVECYVERPRILKCGGDIYEFAFWYRERSGREYLPLLVPNSAIGPAPLGHRRHRQAENLLAAAEQAHLPLKFEFETELLQRATELASWHRLLPSVQLAVRMPHRFELRRRVMDVAKSLGRVRASQIASALEGYPQGDVGCVIGDLIHAGSLRISKQVVFSWNAICEVVPS